MNFYPRAQRSTGGHFGFLASPPTLARTVARAAAHCAIIQRIALESSPADPSLEELLTYSINWLKDNNFFKELEEAEKKLVIAPFGTLTKKIIDPYSAYAETACIIAWALRCAVIPAFDTDADAAEIALQLGWLTDAGAQLKTTAHLRDRTEISQVLDVMSVVHWRLIEHLQRSTKISLQSWSADIYAWPEGVTPVALIHEDLQLEGKSIMEQSSKQLLSALRRIHERHRALLWLLGQARHYSNIITLP